jgi:hypothetical protein
MSKNIYGYIYCGCYNDNHNIKTYKIGITFNPPGRRQYSICKQTGKEFKIIKYVRVKDINKQDLLFVESWLRRELSQHIEYDVTSNDHFHYNNIGIVTTSYITNTCIESIKKALHFIGYKEYKISDKVHNSMSMELLNDFLDGIE